MGGNSSTAKSPEYTKGYENGREESTKEIQGAFSAVAAQVYDGVHSHLEQLQTEQLEKSKLLASDLKVKLAPYTQVLFSDKTLCSTESEAVLQCLKDNAKDPLACSALVQAYSACGMKAGREKK